MNQEIRSAERPEDRVVLNIEDIHAVTLDILTEFDAFCRRHGLNYYLCGGTLLGAVRHKGFIPWDDDIDLFMSRPDYNRLLKLAETESFGKDLVFACAQNKRLMRPFARVYYTRTDVDRKYYIKRSGPHVWIDILPVDGLPKDPVKIRRIFKKRDWIDRFNFATMWKPGTGNRKLMVLRYAACYPIGWLVGPARWCRMMDKLAGRYPYETSEYVGCVTAGRYGPGEAMPRDAFEKPVELPFEGRSFLAMSCYKEYLTGIYGDYMKLPPEKDRHVHVNYVTMSRADYDKLCEKHPELNHR